jgi:hypothetical protein
MDVGEVMCLCQQKSEEGFKYVCFDLRDISVHTDVSNSLCLSETPENSFIFFQLQPLCSRLSDAGFRPVSDRVVFARDIIKGSIVDFHDSRLRFFVYKEDDTDPGYDPIPKYFWRGVSSKLNVSGVAVGDAPADCLLPSHSVSIWNCNALDDIETVKLG